MTCLFLLLTVWNNDNDMRIVDVLYNEYALVHTIKTKDGVSEVLNKLYSKSGSVTPQQPVLCPWGKATVC